jgi:hypothetical protein
MTRFVHKLMSSYDDTVPLFFFQVRRVHVPIKTSRRRSLGCALSIAHRIRCLRSIIHTAKSDHASIPRCAIELRSARQGIARTGSTQLASASFSLGLTLIIHSPSSRHLARSPTDSVSSIQPSSSAHTIVVLTIWRLVHVQLPPMPSHSCYFILLLRAVIGPFVRGLSELSPSLSSYSYRVASEAPEETTMEPRHVASGRTKAAKRKRIVRKRQKTSREFSKS